MFGTPAFTFTTVKLGLPDMRARTAVLTAIAPNDPAKTAIADTPIVNLSRRPRGHEQWRVSALSSLQPAKMRAGGLVSSESSAHRQCKRVLLSRLQFRPTVHHHSAKHFKGGERRCQRYL